MKYICLLIVLLLCVGAKNAIAASSIVINEFQTSSPQTVELYNNGSEAIDLSGWFIDDSGGSTFYVISDETVLPPNKCLSFEASFGFNTASADSVRLFNATAAPTATNAQLIDSFSYDKIIDTTKNHQRIPDGSAIWVTSIPLIDHFNLTGVPCTPPPSPTPTPTPTRTPTPTKTPTPQPTQVQSTVYSTPATYDSIYITEVIPNPESGQNEWVELYNNNNASVILENWRIDDIFEAGASPYPFFLFIPAYSYAVIDLPSAMLNNDGDTVRLLDRNGLQKDNLSYDGVKEKHSVGRNNLVTGAACFTLPSRGAPNTHCITASTTISALLTPTAYPDKTSVVTAPLNSPEPRTPSIKPTSTAHPSTTTRDPKVAPAQLGEGESVFDSPRSPTTVLGTSDVHPAVRILLIVSIMCSLLTISIVLTRMNAW